MTFGRVLSLIVLLATGALAQTDDRLLFSFPTTDPPNRTWANEQVRKVNICRPPCAAGTVTSTPTGVFTATLTSTPTATATPTITQTFTVTATPVFEFGVIDVPAGTDPVADAFADTLTFTTAGICTFTGNSSTDTVAVSCVEAQNLFLTINASSGTDPVADSITDTLNMTGTSPIVVTGDSATDTLTFSWDFSVANTWTGEQTFDAGIQLNDNDCIQLGTAGDATICYDGTNLIVDPRAVGTGVLKIQAPETELVDGGETFTATTDIIEVADALTMNVFFGALSVLHTTSTVTAENDILTANLFANQFTWTNPAGEARTQGAFRTFFDNPTWSFDATSNAQAVNEYSSFYGSPVFSRTGANTVTVGSLNGYNWSPQVNTGVTVNELAGVRINNYTGSGTVPTHYGLRIAALTASTMSVGLENADTTVFPSDSNQSVTAGTAITVDGTFITMTAVGATVMTAAPTIATPASSREQFVCLQNVDTADTITLSDQGTLANSNLRLAAATLALTPRASVCLRYDATVGDWVQWSPLVTVI